MNFGIGTWPPVASHLSCLFLGAMAANLWTSGQSVRTGARLPKDSVTWTLAGERFTDFKSAEQLSGKGIRLGTRSGDNLGGTRCALSNEPLLLTVHEGSILLSLPLSKAASFHRDLAHQSLERLVVIPSSVKSGLCATQPRITYGDLK